MSANLNPMVGQLHLLRSDRNTPMLRITTEKKRGKLVLTVEGRLAGPWVNTLEHCWRDVRAGAPTEKVSVDLCGVSFIDPAGKTLLKEIHHQGGQLLAEGCLNQAIIREINSQGARAKSDHAKNGQTKNGGGSDDDNGSKGGSHIVFYTILFGLLLFPGFGRAQARPQSALPAVAPSGALTLTLEQAVNLALRQNTTAQIAQIAAAESVQDKDVARAKLLPQADLNVGEQWQRLNLAAEFGGGGLPFGGLPPGTTIPGHIGPFSLFSAGVSFGGPIFDLTLFRRYQASRSLANASRLDSQSTREQVVLLIVSQYIGTLRASADVRASQSRVDLAQALYDQAADLQKEGVGTGIDTLRANVELQNEKQRLIEAQSQRETSVFGLSRLLNLDPRQQVELADSLSFFETPQPELEASIEEGLSARPEWKSLEEQIKSAEFQKKASSESRLPSAHYSGNWTQLGVSPSAVIPTYSYAGSVTMPLFTGGRIRAEITRANLEIQRIEQQQADLRNSIALDVKTSLINLGSARNEVQVANLGVQLSNEEVDQARDRFKAGVANNIEVIQAQDSLARANDNQIAALYRFNQARADLARAVGQMEKIYAK
jgi:outer membrane protein